MQQSPLAQVVTISEAVRLFNYGESTIRYHLREGHLIYRQTGGPKNAVILIQLDSLIALWGQPSAQNSTLVSTNGLQDVARLTVSV